MTDEELKNILDWNQVLEKEMGRIDNKRKIWIEIQSSNKAAPSFESWTEENEKALSNMEKHDFSL